MDQWINGKVWIDSASEEMDFAPNLYYWHLSNPVNQASDGSAVQWAQRLYVRENMLLNSTVARG